jgi:hypothetical protein
LPDRVSLGSTQIEDVNALEEGRPDVTVWRHTMPTPLFFVIVPTFQRPSIFKKCLGAFARQRDSMGVKLIRAVGFEANCRRAAAADRDLCDRWVYRGMTLVYAPDIVEYRQHLLGPLSFFRRHFNYGRGAYHVRRALAPRRGQALKQEPLGFYSRLLAYPFVALRGRRRALTPAGLLPAAQTATGFGFVCDALVGTAIPQPNTAGRTNEPAR